MLQHVVSCYKLQVFFWMFHVLHTHVIIVCSKCFICFQSYIAFMLQVFYVVQSGGEPGLADGARGTPGGHQTGTLVPADGGARG